MQKTTSYQKFKTIYWFKWIKKNADAKELEHAKESIKHLEAKLVEIKKRGERKKIENELAKCRNTLARIERTGASIDELADYFFNLEKNINFDKYVTEVFDSKESSEEGYPITKFVGHFQKKSWGNYSSARSCPEKSSVGNKSLLTELLVLDPTNESAYEFGPALIFKVFEAVNFREAVAAFLNSVNFVISECVISAAVDKTTAIYLYEHLANVQSGFGEISRLESYYGVARELSFIDDLQTVSLVGCLEIAYGFIQSKFLGSTIALAKRCFETQHLRLFERSYGVPTSYWLNIEVKDPLHILDEFVEAKRCFEQDPDLNAVEINYVMFRSHPDDYLGYSEFDDFIFNDSVEQQ